MTVGFLGGWVLRSSVLILSGIVLLRALRVRDPSVRLTAWTAMLCASLTIAAVMAPAARAIVAISTRSSLRPDCEMVKNNCPRNVSDCR